MSPCNRCAPANSKSVRRVRAGRCSVWPSRDQSRRGGILAPHTQTQGITGQVSEVLRELAAQRGESGSVMSGRQVYFYRLRRGRKAAAAFGIIPSAAAALISSTSKRLALTRVRFSPSPRTPPWRPGWPATIRDRPRFLRSPRSGVERGVGRFEVRWSWLGRPDAVVASRFGPASASQHSSFLTLVRTPPPVAKTQAGNTALPWHLLS